MTSSFVTLSDCESVIVLKLCCLVVISFACGSSLSGFLPAINCVTNPGTLLGGVDFPTVSLSMILFLSDLCLFPTAELDDDSSVSCLFASSNCSCRDMVLVLVRQRFPISCSSMGYVWPYWGRWCMSPASW